MRSSKNVAKGCLTVWLCCLLPTTVPAEVTFDNSLGSVVTPDTLSGDFEIPAARGELVGPNLFHSFSSFDINTGEIATFTGPGSIANILSRVTGGAASNIDGILRSTIPGANLLLINPAGILFGENASLDISGSFHATTADFVRLDDGVRFDSMSFAEDSTLSVASPSEFGFLTGGKGDITVAGGQLQVEDTKSISLVGTVEPTLLFGFFPLPELPQTKVEVTSGILSAPAGRIDLAQITPGLDQGFLISTSDQKISSQIPGAPNLPAISGSDVYVRAGILQISGAASIGQPGGNIRVDSETVVLKDGGRLSTNSTSAGNSGNITINAVDTVKVTGRQGSVSSAITSTLQDPSGPTQGGTIQISAGQKVVIDGGLVNATAAELSPSNATVGDIFIQTGRFQLINGGKLLGLPLGAKSGGRVSIEAESVEISGFSEIATSVELGIGNAGDVFIDTDNFTISNGGRISAQTTSSGQGGDIQINSVGGQVRLSGAFTSISTGAESDGDAGSIFINTGNVIGANRAEITASTAGSGRGGEININSNNVELINGARISAESTGFDGGDSGNINIFSSDSVQLKDGSNISVRTESADAGSITINTGRLLNLSNGSGITTSVADGEGNGGNINIDPTFVILDGGSQIVAKAKQGSGGDISIVTDFLFQSPDSIIDASSEQGIDGQVSIKSPDSDVVPGIIKLPESLLVDGQILNAPCAADNARSSSFVLNEKGIAPGPDALLTGSLGYVFQSEKSPLLVATAMIGLEKVNHGRPNNKCPRSIRKL